MAEQILDNAIAPSKIQISSRSQGYCQIDYNDDLLIFAHHKKHNFHLQLFEVVIDKL